MTRFSRLLLLLLGAVAFVAVGRTLWVGGGHPRVSRPPLPVPAGAAALSGARGVRLYSAVRGPGVRGVVMFVVGAEVTSQPTYPKLTEALEAAGFATAVVHARGTGYSDGLRGDTADYAAVLGDYRLFLERLLAQHPGRVFLFGHSLGGALALELAGSSPGNRLAGVVLVNPAYRYRSSEGMGPGLRDYVSYAFNLAVRPAALTMDANPAPQAVAFPPDRAEAEAMQRDPLTVRYFSLRYKLAELALLRRCPDNARKLHAPLLLVQGAHDVLIDPAGNDTLLASAASVDKQKLLAAEGGHGASAVETLVQPIRGWLEAHAPAQPTGTGP